MALPGVFCLEGPWSANLADSSSVGPLLEVLERRGIIRYIHRDASTIEELENYLSRWSQRQYDGYRFGYFAFHGEPGAVQLGRQRYTLERMADLLEGRLRNRIVYFGSCRTLEIEEAEADAFRRRTGARAVCGYTTDVDWIEAAAFELNLLDSVTRYQRVDAGFRYLKRIHDGSWERLGFRAVWNGGSSWDLA